MVKKKGLFTSVLFHAFSFSYWLHWCYQRHLRWICVSLDNKFLGVQKQIKATVIYYQRTLIKYTCLGQSETWSIGKIILEKKQEMMRGLGMWLIKFYYNFKIQIIGPVHTYPFSNENGDVLLRIRLSSTLHAENDHRKRSHSKTLSRVERVKNDAFWKRCFLLWTEKTMLSENGDVIDTTGHKTTRPWESKMADRRYHVASISRQFRGPIYWNAHASCSFEHAHWVYKSVFKTNTAL